MSFSYIGTVKYLTSLNAKPLSTIADKHVGLSNQSLHISHLFVYFIQDETRWYLTAEL